MEWAAEGLTLCFIGVLVLLTNILGWSQNPVFATVYWASAAMLVIMAGWTLLTGASISIVSVKTCPLVEMTVAVLFVLGSVL